LSSRAVGQAGGAEPLDHRREQRRRNGEIVRRTPGLAEDFLERLEGGRIVVVAVNVAQPPQQLAQDRGLDVFFRLADAVLGALAHLRQVQFR